jgi:hypothetical protein
MSSYTFDDDSAMVDDEFIIKYRNICRFDATREGIEVLWVETDDGDEPRPMLNLITRSVDVRGFLSRVHSETRESLVEALIDYVGVTLGNR